MEEKIIELTGAEIVIEELVRHDVSVVFGYPGGTVIPLYDAIYDNENRIHHVLTAHEQGAIHAADGYARAKNGTGVVIATSGPGATNLVTGIANAYLDSVPLVAITGNVPVSLIGKDSFQEVDIVGVSQPIVKHNFVVRDIKDLARTIRAAFKIANAGRKGPVLVDIPKDIQTESCEYNPYADFDEIVREKAILKPNLEKVAEAIETINNCKRPFIYVGGGVLAGGVEKEVIELAQKIDAPIAVSMMGLTAIDFDYEYNLGMSGMHGKYAASMAQDRCDTIIALGVRFSDRATGNVAKYINEKNIIHVDIDLAEIGKNVQADTHICGNIEEVMKHFLEGVKESNKKEWLEEIKKFKHRDEYHPTSEFRPRSIIKTVGNNFEEETVVATDVGQHQMWTVQHYEFHKPRTLLSSGGLGTMGYGLGAAIGGCFASGKKETILFTGDGSFSMNLNEMATAVTENLPIVIILFNNNVLGMVRQWQSIFFDGRHSQTTTNRKTDFVALAKAFGAEGHRVTSLEELEEVLKNRKTEGPMLIECPIDKDEMVYPMIPPGQSVKDIILE